MYLCTVYIYAAEFSDADGRKNIFISLLIRKTRFPGEGWVAQVKVNLATLQPARFYSRRTVWFG
jgi:hypothetical protein